MAHLPNPARNHIWRHLGLLVLFSMAAGCSDDAAPVTPPQSPLLALTPTEYNNTICDLFAFPRNGRQWPAPQHTLNGKEKYAGKDYRSSCKPPPVCRKSGPGRSQ